MSIFIRKTNELGPPYSAYSTFLEVIGRLRELGIPTKLRPNADLQGPLSDTIYSQAVRALRFFGLATVDETPEESLIRLLNASGDEYRNLLREMVESSYTFLFDSNAEPLNLTTATMRELEAQFEQVGITGSTVRRSMTFFIKIAQDAGIPLSAELLGEQASMTQDNRLVGHLNGKAALTATSTGSRTNKTEEAQKPSHQKSLNELPMPPLPPFNEGWSIAAQENWLYAYSALVSAHTGDKKPGI